MKRQVDAFCAALLYCTRIPIRRNIPYSPHLLQYAARYFPWAAILIGCMSACTWLITCHLLSTHIAVFLSILTSILLTGALQENAFAVTCNAFGNGWNKERMITLLEENNLDTLGLIGLASIIAFRFLLLIELCRLMPVSNFIWLLIAGQSISHFTALTLQQQYPYVAGATPDEATPPSYRKLSQTGLLVAALGAFAPLAALPLKILPAILPVAGVRWYMGRFFFKRIGGYTSDCYGAVQQVAEACVYTGSLALWKHL